MQLDRSEARGVECQSRSLQLLQRLGSKTFERGNIDIFRSIFESIQSEGGQCDTQDSVILRSCLYQCSATPVSGDHDDDELDDGDVDDDLDDDGDVDANVCLKLSQTPLVSQECQQIMEVAKLNFASVKFFLKLFP